MDTNLLIIDAYNLAFRIAFNRTQLSWQNKNTSLVFGFLKSLGKLMHTYEGYFPVLIWDSGHERRDRESEEGVRKGIIPEKYKANRKHDSEDEKALDVMEQIEELRQDFLPHVHALQAIVKGYEADDLACSYSRQNGGRTLIVTSDKDYYQLLSPKTEILDCMKDQIFTDKWFFETYGFEPRLWVDCGALMGDVGDNIFGVPGVGEKTACKLIREYGAFDKVIEALKNKEKRSKIEETIINNEERVKLAYSLKRMDEIEKLPKLRCPCGDPKKLEELFESHGFVTLVPYSNRFCWSQ